MRRTPMQVSVESILQAHGLIDEFRTDEEFYAKIAPRADCWMPLVIERLPFDQAQVSISHTFIQYGDVMRDPEIVFDWTTWEPLEITQDPVGGYRRKFISRDDGRTLVDMGFRPAVMPLVRAWARNLRHQPYKDTDTEVYR